jgi:hypothetical protein
MINCLHKKKIPLYLLLYLFVHFLMLNITGLFGEAGVDINPLFAKLLVPIYLSYLSIYFM